jgi:hypothetical protein
MRCIACGGTTRPCRSPVAFMWASCHDTDQRLMFSKNTPVPETETALVPVRSPTSVFRNLRAVAKGLLGLAFCKMPRIRKG